MKINLAQDKFEGLIRPTSPIIIVTANWDERQEIAGLADSQKAAAQLIKNCSKMIQYHGAKFSYIMHVVWSIQDE